MGFALESHYANPGFAFCESMRIYGSALDSVWIRRFQYCGSKKIWIGKNPDPANPGFAKMRIQRIQDSLDPQYCGSSDSRIRIMRIQPSSHSWPEKKKNSHRANEISQRRWRIVKKNCIHKRKKNSPPN